MTSVVNRKDTKAVVQPDTDIVAGSVTELRSAFRGLVADGVREMVINLSNVNMIDSSGIGLLIAAHNSLARLGGHLSVTGASRDILELLHAMRIHQHFSVSAD